MQSPFCVSEIFRNNHQTASVYWKKLKGCLVDTDAGLEKPSLAAAAVDFFSSVLLFS